MASLNVIRTLTIRATAEGAAQTEAALRRIAATQKDVVITSEQQTKASLSVEAALRRLQTRYDQEFRAQQELARVQRVLNQAREQGLISASRQSDLMQNAVASLNSNTKASQIAAAQFQQLMQGMSSVGSAALQSSIATQKLTSGMTAAGQAAAAQADQMQKAAEQTRAASSDRLVSGMSAVGKATLETSRANERLISGMSAAGRSTELSGKTTEQFSSRTKAARYELINLSRQVQDVGVSLASGQSVMNVFIQQGSQIADVFASSSQGAGGLARSLLGIITPGRAIVLAFGAITAAATGLFMLLRENSPTIEQSLKTQADLLGIVKQAYGNAAETAGKFYDQSKRITELRVQENLMQLREQLDLASRAFERQSTRPTSVPSEIPIPFGVGIAAIEDAKIAATAFTELNRVIDAFNASARKSSDVQAFRDAIAGIGIASRETNPELSKQADELIRNTDELGKTASAVQKAEAMLRMLAGSASEADRALLGLSATLQSTAFEQFAQRTSDRIEELRLEASTAGRAAGAVAALRLQHEADRLAKREGVVVDQQRIDILKKELSAATDAAEASRKQRDTLTKEALSSLDVMRANVSALGDAATAAEKYQLQLAELTDKLQQGTISQDTFNRAARALNPTMIQIKDVVSDLGESLSKAFIQGQSAADALQNSLKSVAASASSSAIKSLISGDFASAATSGLIAIGGSFISKLFGGSGQDKNAQAQAQAEANQKQLEQAVERQRQAMLEAQQIQTKAVNAYADAVQKLGSDQQVSQVVSRFQEIQGAADELAGAFATLGQSSDLISKLVTQAVDRLRASFVGGLERELTAATGQGFINQIQDLVDEMNQRISDAGRLGVSTTLVREVFQAKAQEVVTNAQLTGDAFDRLLRIFPDLAGAVRQFGDSAEEVAKRTQSLEDRMFAALVDTSTLEGALLAFDRDAQRQREEEARLGGAAMVQLEETLALERLAVQKQFNDRLIQQVQNLVTTVNQFLLNLQVGPQSTLSPIARLAAAQSQYNTTLAQAQAGNFDAANQITGYASQLLDAAKNVYGSTGGYAALFNQITTQLQALPAQVSAAQHIVDAVNANTDSVDAGNQISQNQKLVLDIINASTAATNAQVVTANALQSSANTLITTTNSLLDSILALQNSALNQLFLQNQQLQILITISNSTNATANFCAQIALNTATIAGWAPNTNHYSGGWVYGPPGRDTVRSNLTAGEYVVNANAARRLVSSYGTTVFDAWINRGNIPPTGANDNMSVVAALLEQLIREVKRNSAIVAASAEHIREPLDGILSTNEAGIREQKFQAA